MHRIFQRFTFPLLFAVLFAISHFGIWAFTNHTIQLLDAPPIVRGFAYSGYQKDQSPLERKFPSTAELAKDLKLLDPLTNRIRLYGSLENSEVTAIASKLNFNVIAGAWIGPDHANNAREIAALEEKIKFYPNIQRAIVGNEVLLRRDLTLEQLTPYLDEVRKATEIPISTAEPWHVWLKNPELVKHVDFIAVHLLPYHEGVPVEDAVNYAMQRYNELMNAYPRKKNYHHRNRLAQSWSGYWGCQSD